MISKFQVHSSVVTVLTGISGHFTIIPKPELLKGIWGKRIPPYPTHSQKKEDGPRVTNQDLVNTYSCKRRLIWSDLPKANLLHNKHFTQNPAWLEWWILPFLTPNRFSFSTADSPATKSLDGWKWLTWKGHWQWGGCRDAGRFLTAKPNQTKPGFFCVEKNRVFWWNNIP